MTSEARPGVEGLEAEGFGGRGVDDLPDVDAHPVEQDLQFVDHCDVHAAIDVLQDFGRLGHLARGDRHDPLQGHAVKLGGHLGAAAIDAADDLGNGPRGEMRVAGILAFGAEGQVEIAAGLQATPLFEDRLQDLSRRAGIGRRLEHHDLPFLQGLGDLPATALDKLDVRLAHFVQRRGHADDDGVDLAELTEIVGGPEASGLDVLLDHAGRDVLDVTATGIQLLDLSGVDVETDDGELSGTEFPHQGQPDIAQSDDADFSPAALDSLHKVHPFSRSQKE